MLLAILTIASLLTFDPTEEPTISESVATHNFMGIFGVYISHYLIKMTIGWGSYVFPVILGWFGLLLLLRIKLRPFFRHALFLLAAGALTGISITIPQLYQKADVLDFTYSGLWGGIIAKFLHDFIGFFGLVLILVILVLILISAWFRLSLFDVFSKLLKPLTVLWKKITVKKPKFPKLPKQKPVAEKHDQRIKKPLFPLRKKKIEAVPVEPETGLSEPESPGNEPIVTVPEEKVDKPAVTAEDSDPIDPDADEEELKSVEIEEMETIVEGDADKGKNSLLKYRQYKLPSVELLDLPPEIQSDMSPEQLKLKAEQLKHALETFGVSGKIVRISPGPVITLFEIEPAEGVRVNKFTSLSDDIARSMEAQRIRVIAPIPGLKTVGIEVPNDNPAIVALRSIISSEKFINSKSKLTIAMGKTTKGDAFVTDLAKMPHMLIAGATGSGKSICINTIIISILYAAKPDEVKFIMIDPKKLELFTYKTLEGYHLITSANLDEYVMTTPSNAVSILNSALSEMERRYTLFANSTVRNISEYHEKSAKNPDMESIPYVVVLIDELADLMMTAGKDVEEPITRLAQMARAVGIHLVVATQRPSVDVITGLIKANFPARIAFQVSQKVDSRTIIDQMGAEKLLGKGDMLFLPPGASEPIRLHNAYISTAEIEAVMDHIRKQPKPEEILLPEIRDKSIKPEFRSEEEQDELLMEAAKLVIEQGQASVSLLQRRFRIGYSRAGRLIDELEALGVVAGYGGSKARDVLVDSSYLDDMMES